MEPTDTLLFSLDDRIDGVEVTPAHVPLALLGQFQDEVTKFLRGSSRDVDPMHVQVAIEHGSLRFAASELSAATTLWSDLSRLEQPDFMDYIDPKRAEIIEIWQSASYANPSRRYAIADNQTKQIISVNSQSNFRKQLEESWVTVEKYIYGRVVDQGGKKQANVHLELEDGKSLIISARKELLEKEEKNLLYKSALLHVMAEENLKSGELRNLNLQAFEKYEPSYNDEIFKKMVERGTRAWSDVEDAALWIEDLRGGAH